MNSRTTRRKSPKSAWAAYTKERRHKQRRVEVAA